MNFSPKGFFSRYSVIGASLVAVLVIWLCLVAPYILKLSRNFSYKADLLSQDNFYNPISKAFGGVIYSKAQISFIVEKEKDDVLIIKNLFEAKKPNGEKIYAVERKYGINPITGEHVKYYGDRVRSGYLFAPRGLAKGQEFIYWHINYNVPAYMHYKGVEHIQGLKVYKYQARFKADQSKELGLPNALDKRGVELDVVLNIWVEPLSGYLIKYQDTSIAWYYDIKSHQRLIPWNRFSNAYSNISIADQVEQCKKEREKIILVNYGVPLALVLVLIIVAFQASDSKNRVWHVYAPTFLSLVIGAGISLMAYFFLSTHQESKNEQQLVADCRNIQNHISAETDKIINILYNLKGLAEADQFPSKAQFDNLASYYLNKSKDIQALEWLPKVPHANRQSFEKQAAKEYPGYYIKDFVNKQFEPAKERAFYFPVYYVAPQEKNFQILGYDLNSELVRSEALKNAANSNQVYSSTPVKLVQSGHHMAVLFLVPVFSKAGSLMGAFVAIYKIENLIPALVSYPDYNQNIAFDFYFGERKPENKVSSLVPHENLSGVVVNNKLQVANRVCEISFMPVASYYNRSEEQKNSLVLFIGLAFSVLISLFIYWILSNNRQELELSNLKLAKASSNLKSLIDSTTDRIVAIDDSYHIIAFNEAYYTKTMEYSGIKIALGMPLSAIFTLVTDSEKQEMYADWKEALCGKTVFKEQTFSAPNLSNKSYEIVYAPIKNKAGNVIGASQNVREITERKKADALIESRTRQMEEAQELAQIGSWEWDIKKGVSSWSPQLYKIYEVDQNNQTPDYTPVLHPDDKALVEQTVLKASKDYQPFDIFHRVISKDGSVKVVHSKGAVILDKDGNAIKMNGTVQDVTRIKAIEDELLNAKELAEQSVVAKERFLANMSHEIRTPMNAVIGFSEILGNTSLSAKQQEYVQAIKISGENLLNVINDILDYSKIEAEMMTLENRPFSINELFSKIDILFRAKAEDKGLKFVFNIHSSVPKIVLGDSLRLHQILTNLIGNAIKFTESGMVSINAFAEKGKDHTVEITFIVKDTGIGIPEEKIQSIFERFSQANNETSRRYGGSGLGLTIVKGLIDLQGGTIDIQSKQGEGSAFTLTLKYKISSEQEIPIFTQNSAYQYGPGELGKLKILLAEDNLINQKLAQHVLSDFGFEVQIASNGKEALEMVKHEDFDLVLMDIQMPEMDGYTATGIIRTQLKNTLPIVAMTAHAMAGEKEKCLKIGMNEYISKPFTAKGLYDIIGRAVKGA